MYVVGGFNDVEYSSAVYRATLQAGGISSWTALNPIPVGIRDHAVVISTNTIYVLGGRDDSNIYNAIYYATINTDGSLGQWQTSTVNLPTTLWGHTAVYSNGYIYLAGGANTMTATAARANVYYSKVLADNNLSTFTAATNLPQARNGHSMVAQGDKVYVIAGFTTGGTKRNTVYTSTSSNSGTLGSWTAATTLPVSISNHSSVIMNGLLTVMAGEIVGNLSNSVYYADVTASPLVWTLSPNVLYDRTKDGTAFASNGQLIYSGGENLSGTPIHNTRYAPLTLLSNFKKAGFFVSNPFYELGAERVITELTYTASTPAGTSISISYRTAGEDMIWGNWTVPTSVSPVPVGLTKRYLQYKVIYTSDGTSNASFNEMNLLTPGTELAGNLNSWNTFTLALSPYWITADISLTSGTHNFEAGVVFNFLPETGFTISQANVVCNGTAGNPVKFRYYTNESGGWDGIYFDPNSDNGVSSQFNYVTIENAGFGSWNANLYCSQTNEPLLINCTLKNADGNGLRLNSSSITVEDCLFDGNIENGIYLENANPSFINSISSNNGDAGIFFTSTASVPNFSNMALNTNLCGIRFPSPNFTIVPMNGTVSMTGNTYDGICIDEGDVTSNQVWNTIAFDYIMLGNLNIGKYADVCRLTIEPGNKIKFLTGKKMQVGYHSNYHYAGELYAIGTFDSTITFTAFNGTSGGWEGIYFEDRSDYYGATSYMDYCIVEKGNDYNLFVENSTMPAILNCTFRNAVTDGVKCYNAYNSIETSNFVNNGRYPLYFAEPLTLPTITGNTWTGNGINLIGFSGGNITEDRTLQYDGIGYHIIDNIMVGKYAGLSQLTIEPGNTLYFEAGKMIQVGYHSGYHYGGELYAEGTAGMPVTFTPYDGVAGSWNGIYFEDRSDYNGGINSLKYCVIEKANDYNIYCENTASVTIDNCTIKDAVTDGLRYNASFGSFTDNIFENNGRYPVYIMDWTSQPFHKNNTFNSKGINYIALSGGIYTENKTFYVDNAEYLVLDNILIGKYA
ncbi:MAG: right-handed parallel beta-helix repeat-containing protein, partial [Bacteroidales bacterium]|nr:right-handed parallel beta-helix repeat-containing protein [Bacteroidales bacterium]